MKNKLSIAMTLALILAMLVTSLALASSVDTSVVDVTTPTGSVTLQPGQSGSIVINMTVTGNQAGTATFDVYREWTLSGGNFVGSNPQTFSVPPRAAQDPATTFSTSGTVSVDSSQGIGTFTLAVSAFNITNSNQTGAKLSDGHDSSYQVTVAAPPPPSDTTPPVINPNIVGTLGNNDWYTSDVTVNWTVTDLESAITSTSGCDSTTISADTSGITLTCSATSTGGTSSQSVTIKRDATAPSITGTLAPSAPSSSGWYNIGTGAPTVTWNCLDAMSGVASCPAQYTFGEGVSQSQSGTVYDAAGNSASASVSNVNVDLTDPTISGSISPAPNAAGWNNTDVSVTFACSDGISGIATCGPNQILNSEGANQSQSGTAVDNAGNSASTNVTDINIDKTAPSAGASVEPAANANGWNNTDVTVSFSGSDGLSGIDSCTLPVVLSGEGVNQSASGTCTDLAGNVSDPATANGINIDKTAPTATASVLPAPNGAGWNNTDVTVSFSGSDALSGNDFCDADVVLSSEGIGQSASGTCTDKAGNVSAPAIASDINIDKTPPTVSWTGGPEEGASYYFGFVPLLPAPEDVSISDNLSSPNLVGVSGYSPEVGTHTMIVTATDLAGNEKVETRTYTVLAWTLNGFYKPVDMSGLITVWNTVKGGSTVPLKFEVFAGSTELTDVSVAKSLNVAPVSCTLGWEDAIEETISATGGTSLRYDWTVGQFIYNWQTPKKAGSCYRVTLVTQDGSSISALFKLK